jgi:hypothetical protein
MTAVKLAEALLRRKELQEKVDQLKHLKDNQIVYQIRAQRIKVTDGLEDLNADYPKMEANQVTAEYDHYARALRLVDAAIQQANWTHEMQIDEKAMSDYLSKQ